MNITRRLTTLPSLGVGVAILILLTATTWAEEAQWRVMSTTTPTTVPLYANQASPFPQSVAAARALAEPVGPTPAELEAEQQKSNLYLKTQGLLARPESLEPELSGFRCGGSLQGPQGTMALCNGVWTKTGATYQVPARLNEKAQQALAALGQLDAAAADELRGNAARRAAGTTLKLTVTGMTADKMTLGANGQSWSVPLRQEN